MKTRLWITVIVSLVLVTGVADIAFAQSPAPAAPSPVSEVQVQETRTVETRPATPADTTAPAQAPAATWTVFGMDSTAGVMIGLVLMLVFILAIVAVSRNERTTVA